ncbi:MAG TPA: TMEM175 family protein, partial [Burkholderiaceae bacterium]|nr:TMEM175 family protein [Burkholderiaceae bacterium]
MTNRLRFSARDTCTLPVPRASGILATPSIGPATRMPHTDPAPAPHDTSSGPPPPPGIGRVEAFSDGVIAIIITIMVLELKPPQLHAVNSMWTEILVPMWPKLLAYAWSFLAVGSMWINHHHLLNSLRSASRPLAWLNLQLLFWMSLVPVSTALI